MRGGNPEHLLAATPDDDRRAAGGEGRGATHRTLNLVVLPPERRRVLRPQLAEHLERFGHPLDAHAGRIQGDARLLVVGRHPPGTDPELDATLAQHVQSRHVASEHDRMAVVVVVHQRADLERGGDLGRDSERHRRAPGIAEVVVQEQRRVAERLGLAGRLPPRLSVGGVAKLDAEAKRTHWSDPSGELQPNRGPGAATRA